MGRYPQKKGKRGSQFWIQNLVNKQPKVLNAAIEKPTVNWLSPLDKDDYAEYRDQAFIKMLDIKLKERSLKSFWPNNGPQWDALGKSKSGEIILVEAKSHINEIFSHCTAKSDDSLDTIHQSLKEASTALNAEKSLVWTKCFYQYCNRIAHAFFLKEINSLPIKLIFLYFINDTEMNGPKTRAEWKSALKVLHKYLDLTGKLPNYVKEVFIKVGK